MKAIVTTTINPPTLALGLFARIAQQDDWTLYIVGDLKTPHDAYLRMESENDRVKYLTPERQAVMSSELSELIGWNCIQRRNFGFLAAYSDGAEVIATVDDDNIPYPGWGRNCSVNQTVTADLFTTQSPVFDPLQRFRDDIWHRGFPVQMLDDRETKYVSRGDMHCLVQADLWDGAPDVDAINRIAVNPMVHFKGCDTPYYSDKLAPFNSQNTFLSSELFPDYFLFPHIGRMDDIWAAYVVQYKRPNSVLFCKPSVYQDRNPHDLVRDLEAEMIGYKHSKDIVGLVTSEQVASFDDVVSGLAEHIPVAAIQAYEVYRNLICAQKIIREKS